MVLGLVEPQSSGIGGGGFLLYYDAAARNRGDLRRARDCHRRPPTNVSFWDADGTPRPWQEVAVGGLPVGVPGVVRMLEHAHRSHCRTPWPRLFEPATALAKHGFVISPRLASMIEKNPGLARFPASRTYFFHANGSPKRAGEILINPAYAETMRAIAQGGADALHQGWIAAEIIAAVQNDPVNPGLSPLPISPAIAPMSGRRCVSTTGATGSAAWALPAPAG